MSKVAWLALAVIAFTVIGTANSGGYRYGVSDQAFYVPAVALRADPALFPKDRALLEPQMRLWLGDEILGAVTRVTGISLPVEFAVLYAVTMVLLASGAVMLARRLGCGWWTVAAFLILLTLRHRIAKTGANSLEGYFHPRMLSFALGLFVLAAIAARRFGRASIWLVASALVHPTTGLWFALVLAVAGIWSAVRTQATVAWITVGVVTMILATIVLSHVVPGVNEVMPSSWLAVLGEKDYLFVSDWPIYAWVANLASALIIGATFRARTRRGLTTPGEEAMVAGLLALVVTFASSIVPTESHVALAVQLQVNRVFWLLDLVAVLYLAWWLTEGAGVLRRPVLRGVLLGILAVAAIGRGFYVVHVETDRPLITWALPTTDWTDAMAWLGTQPVSWHVLADPGHAWKYGSSVRVAARRDTLLETGKDTAFAMYDRGVAMQVADRLRATASFDTIDVEAIRGLRARFQLDVMVDRVDRSFPLPVLYRNRSFVLYDLR